MTEHEVILKTLQGCPAAVCSCGDVKVTDTPGQAAEWGARHIMSKGEHR